jgi:hypothetical protein
MSADPAPFPAWLTWTWCLPQALLSALAAAVALRLGAREGLHRGVQVLRMRQLRRLGGVCLGTVILVPDDASPTFLDHEWGHWRQQRVLGPFYLLVIGIPSLSHALLHRALGRDAGSYHRFYTEAWADQAGGIYHLFPHRHRFWWPYLLEFPLLPMALGGGLWALL